MHPRRPSVIGPLLLITIGVLFLLSNMGVLPFSIWEISARFWPLILILVGLEIIIGRRSTLGALVVVVLWIALVGGVLGLAYAQGSGLGLGAATVSDQYAQPLGDIQSATIELNIGTARTNVTALTSDTSDLLRATFQHAQGTRVVKSYTVAGNEGRLALREEGANFIWAGSSVSRWEIGLNPTIPIALRITGGIGRATLDLSDLKVSALTLDAGVGSIDVTTPKAGVTTMRLNGGVGSARITVPPGVAARIRVNSGLGGVNVDTARFAKAGDTYASADYASAANKLEIDLNGGVGSITVR